MPRAVILTALSVEYQAVCNRLIELEEKLHPLGTVYQQGKFIAEGQEWKVGIAEVGTGNAEAAAEVERAIAYFQPNIILFVGIAGGIKDVAIGDVVVATEVYKHESGKITEKFLTRPKAGKSAYSLVQRAKFEAKQEKWLQQPRVFVGPIVAGEKVIASRQSAIFQLLRESYNDAIAVEMEGFGFLNAAFAHPKIPAIVIRGISDLIEGKNDDAVEPEDIRQEKASQHASAFAFEMLSKLKITSQETREQGTGSRELRRSSLQSIFSRVTQWLGWLPPVASCAITAVGGFKLIQGEIEQLTAILLAGGFVSLLSICLYIWLKGSRINGSVNSVPSVKQYSKKTRKLAFVGLFVVALLMVVSGRNWYHQQSLLKNQVVVLVANFENPQDEKWGVTKDIIHQLEEALEEYDDVEVQALNEEITAQEGIKVARAKGEKHHADIVLWGWYQDTSSHAKVTVKFEVLEKLRSLSSVQTEPLTQEIAKLKSFEIQTQLSKEMSYLTLFTIGLVRYEAKDYDAAIARFTKALAFAPDAEEAIVQDTDTAINALYFYRGVAYYYKGEPDKAIVDYNQVLKIYPKLAEAYNNRGIAYGKKGELNKALDDFNRALEINPKDAFASYNRGIAYSDKRELNKALDDFDQALKINPKFAEAYYNRGNAYRKKGELDLAITDYTQALKINPEDAEAYYNRGNAYSDKGELDRALADFTQALKIDPEYVKAYNNRGLAYSDKGELDQALADFTQALKINPEYAEAYYNRGNAYSDKGELDQALADFTQALKLNPEYAEAYYNRGNAYSNKGKLDQALADFNLALKINPEDAEAYNNRGIAYSDKGELDRALADFNLALQINPEDAKAYNNRGIAYSDKGELDRALADFNLALQINPKFAEAYNNRGNVYRRKGELDQAIADYTQALKINPEYVAAYINRGSVYSKKGELDQAIADFNRALQINPEVAEPYNNRGITYYDKGELDRALADFNRALQINPEDAEVYNNRGNAYSDKGELDQAISDFNQALKINPKLAQAYNNRGITYYDKGELDQAIADFTQALQINPKDAAAYNNRGNVYRRKGELDQAIADFTQALKINPKDALAYINRGNAYSNKRELDRAIADFTQALKINPQLAQAYGNRGIAYSKLGDKQEAIQDFQKAAKLFAEQGNTANQEKALELLKQLQQD